MLDEIRKTDWTPRSVHRKARQVFNRGDGHDEALTAGAPDVLTVEGHAVETRAIAEVMTSLALANLSAAFRLESNGRTLMDLPATRDLPSRAASLWGDDFAGALIPVTWAEEGVHVAGLVERPDAAVSGPRRVHLFIAGRPFRERALVAAAERGHPALRPLFFEFPDDPTSWLVEDQYLFGRDILVAPLRGGVRAGAGPVSAPLAPVAAAPRG
mgnify:CR=1 FL=1